MDMALVALYINELSTSINKIKDSFRLGSKVHAISNTVLKLPDGSTDTTQDSSFTKTTSGVLADKCEKA